MESIYLKDGQHEFNKAASEYCNFNCDIFENVVLNLIQNPDITSTHVFRANVFWDSERDSTFNPHQLGFDGHVSSFVRHMRPEVKPRFVQIENFELRRSLVREFVPRNPQLDWRLTQTCHFFRSICSTRTSGSSGNKVLSLILLLPHVNNVSEIPWYHPKVKGLAFLYEETEGHKGGNIDSREGSDDAGLKIFSILIANFDRKLEADQYSNRLQRTVQNLLKTILKHGDGQLNGYKKRVHHDQVVSQSAFQDTYIRLKLKYAKDLLGRWREETDCNKGVFEDLGIAAFLIELWSQLYVTETHGDGSPQSCKPSFPGFVDVGCGNGMLVAILCQEGYSGYGFDARKRKTWDALPDTVRGNLSEMVLVPDLLLDHPSQPGSILSENNDRTALPTHRGLFNDGTFLISNHADELTLWTPLLAYFSSSPFICIPCCSRGFNGDKFRANPKFAQKDNQHGNVTKVSHSQHADDTVSRPEEKVSQTTSSMPSAYASLTGYIAHLSSRLEFEVLKEMLRIPSTRNACIFGKPDERAKQSNSSSGMRADRQSKFAKRDAIIKLLEEETGKSVSDIIGEWTSRAERVVRSKGSCSH